MKKKDKFGNPIYPSIFKKMKEYAKKLRDLGFRESKNKPNLFYWKNKRVIIFADMRGYKGSYRFIPVWDENRKGKPRFYQRILSYDDENVGKINRILWNKYQKIKEKGIDYFLIDPSVEPPSSWSRTENIPAPRFFLEHSSIPLKIKGFWKQDFFYSGICRECGRKIDGKKLLCSKCRERYNSYLPKCPVCGKTLNLEDLGCFPISLSELKEKKWKKSRLISACSVTDREHDKKFFELKTPTCDECGVFISEREKGRMFGYHIKDKQHHYSESREEVVTLCPECHRKKHEYKYGLDFAVKLR